MSQDAKFRAKAQGGGLRKTLSVGHASLMANMISTLDADGDGKVSRADLLSIVN